MYCPWKSHNIKYTETFHSIGGTLTNQLKYWCTYKISPQGCPDTFLWSVQQSNVPLGYLKNAKQWRRMQWKSIYDKWCLLQLKHWFCICTWSMYLSNHCPVLGGKVSYRKLWSQLSEKFNKFKCAWLWWPPRTMDTLGTWGGTSILWDTLGTWGGTSMLGGLPWDLHVRGLPRDLGWNLHVRGAPSGPPC